MLGVAHTLYREKKHDQALPPSLHRRLPTSSSPHLLGRDDGQPKSAEWAATICGVEAKVIRQLALGMAAKRTMIMAGWGMQRQHHEGAARIWMLITLAAMLGQIGPAGGGYGFSYHYSSGGSPTARDPGRHLRRQRAEEQPGA